MPNRARTDYELDLQSRLADPRYAAAYLNAVLEDTEEGADQVLLLALRDVAAAFNVSSLASSSGINRENLYRVLSHRGDPKLSTLVRLLTGMGLRFAVQPITPARPHMKRSRTAARAKSSKVPATAAEAPRRRR